MNAHNLTFIFLLGCGGLVVVAASDGPPSPEPVHGDSAQSGADHTTAPVAADPVPVIAPSPEAQEHLDSARALRCAMQEALDRTQQITRPPAMDCDTGLRAQRIQ